MYIGIDLTIFLIINLRFFYSFCLFLHQLFLFLLKKFTQILYVHCHHLASYIVVVNH